VLTFDREEHRFKHRVAGACLHAGHVLLTRAEDEEFWLLPGGRVEFHEYTREPRSTAS
jgi:8-oxo-dGTP pyrophosphatase MutT (NUDIX family)